MTQVEDIRKYLTKDVIFNKINEKFISMDPDDIKDNNQFLKKILEELLIGAMKKESPLFTKTYQKIVWAGSYYKGTRVGQPEEYDLNFVINLPFKEKDIEFSTDRPGFVKIRYTAWKDRNLDNNSLNLDPKAYNELKSFIDDQSYLDQEKFRRWMKGILSKVAHATGGNNSKNRIIFDGCEPIRINESGPAFTLTLKLLNSRRTIDIDIVPVFVYSISSLPSIKCSTSKRNFLDIHSYRYWSAVPKPLYGFGNSGNRYWRLCFYEFEQDLLCDHNYQSMKPVIRQLKKLRNNQGWKSVASYYLETLCYHESEMFHMSQKNSMTVLFFTMLEKLRDAFQKRSIIYYWDDNHNLLEKIGHSEMENMKGRLDNALKSIRKDIKEDPYAIAKWVLSSDELRILKSLEHEITSNSTSESEPEASAQGKCVIF